jgi:hypothetical protein
MPAYTLRTETVGSITYVGQAAIGSSESDPVWRIRRITDTAGNLTLEYVDGNAEWDSVWDNRAGYSYS